MTSEERPLARRDAVRGDCGNGDCVAIRKCDVLCCERVAAISELACVAISFFFAFWLCACFMVRFEESSFDSRWSLRMPMLLGSAVAIRNSVGSDE